MIYIKDIIEHVERWAPLRYAESYDNCGLLVGDKQELCSGVLLSLDITEDVIWEAVQKKCNFIISHHPFIFSPIHKVNTHTHTEKLLILAIRNHIQIYALHTNLDNIKDGVNASFAHKIGLRHHRILEPQNHTLRKLCTFLPKDSLESFRQAMFDIGVGRLGAYSECSFSVIGEGTFKPDESAKPFIGKSGERVKQEEVKIEFIYPAHKEALISQVLIEKHPYEEPAFDYISLENTHKEIGSGAIGELERPLLVKDFLCRIQQVFKVPCIKHSHTDEEKLIKQVALCGGSGSFLIHKAMQAGADAYVTADLKYHDYFRVSKDFLLCDIGHYESEVSTISLIYTFLLEKMPTFAIHKTAYNTNPVQYFL